MSRMPSAYSALGASPGSAGTAAATPLLRRQMTMRTLRLLLAGTALGAGTMYLYHPDRGRRRRHVLQDRARAARNDVETLAGKAERDLENRMQGAAARLRGSPPTQHAERGAMSEGTPERRIVEGVAGAAAGLWGVSQGGLTGVAAIVAGGYLLARSVVPMQRGAIRVQKTITIAAPVEQVYDFWSRFENFPRFMEHVLDVRISGDRSHWRVKGPGGIALGWDAQTVERVPNRKLVWRSLEESSVLHHGEVHFERLGERQTRVSLHMAYEPPSGALGHAVSGFLLGNPKRLIDQDLLRLKSLLEEGRTRAHARDVRAEDLR
jgi:uncharacterized membrane protein